jgi:site-specific DNA recombinase
MPDNSWKASGINSILRCAIYTRKSHEEGLDQEFNSLDAQRESAEVYIESQKSLGWTALPDRYDDGGYSGGNMERPALQRLIDDIDSGKVDVIVVYKIDRLSRALLDFTKMIDMFNDRGVSFVSVTQQISSWATMWTGKAKNSWSTRLKPRSCNTFSGGSSSLALRKRWVRN